MALICILSFFIAIAIVLYAICAASSRTHRHIENRSLLFLPQAVAKPLEDLLSEGDVESVYRIMKGLHQRGDIHVIETGNEMIIMRPETFSEDLEKITVPT